MGLEVFQVSHCSKLLIIHSIFILPVDKSLSIILFISDEPFSLFSKFIFVSCLIVYLIKKDITNHHVLLLSLARHDWHMVFTLCWVYFYYLYGFYIICQAVLYTPYTRRNLLTLESKLYFTKESSYCFRVTKLKEVLKYTLQSSTKIPLSVAKLCIFTLNGVREM